MNDSTVLNSQDRGQFTSASNAQADELCPGRHLAQRGMSEPASEYAAQGSRIHAALAKQDPAGLTLEELNVFDACNEIAAKMVAQLWPSTNNPLVVREKRWWVHVPGPIGTDGKPSVYYPHSGQLDVFYRTGVDAIIIEFKTLQGDVPESPKNFQLRDQAVLLARQPSQLLNNVAVLVVQPLVTHTPEVTMYGPKDIAEAERRMFARVQASNNPASPRIAGEAQCKYCLAKNVCGTYQKFAGAMVPQMLTLLDVPVSAWTPEQRGMFLDRRKVAQDWLDNCEKAMREGMATNLDFATGWTLAPGRVRETIVGAQECFQRFLEAGGKPEQFMATVSIGKTRLAEQLAAATGLKGMKLKAAMEAMLEGLVKVTTDAPTLKRKDEK